MGNSVKKNVPVCSDNKSKPSGEGQDKVNLTRSINFRKVSAWNLGSLSERLNWSFGGYSRSHTTFFKSGTDRNRDRSNSSRQYRKTTWPKPHTDSIFLSHFKRFSRNEEFAVEDVIAEGAFGIVFKVENNQNPDQKYALKVLKKSKIIQDNSVLQIKNEVDIQKLCGHHPFIVEQVDTWQNKSNLHILLEFIPHGELFTQICKFPYELIRLYIAEISLAIDFLHNAGVIYRDVKPENILLSGTYHIKIADFGLSKWLKFGERTRTMCGTFQYMAPEILNGGPYGHSIDWWAIGVVACRMLTNKYPNTGLLIKDSPPEGDDVIDLFLPEEVNSIPPEGKDLLVRLLEQDPKVRLKSVLGLQRIAMYKGFEIETDYILNIVGCTFEGNRETSGLEGIKFRLDETGDITWYNDLISPLPESKGCNTCCESANVLFSCETFDVNALNPRLIFGAFAGHSIEFNTQTLAPDDTLILECENWYSLLCKRLQEDQAVGQETEFSFLNALTESYFCDVIVKSSDGLDYHVHSVILRLNGFDCSMCSQTGSVKLERAKSFSITNQVKISITIPNAPEDGEQSEMVPKLNLSPIYLRPPSLDRGMQKMSNLSSSFNCLASATVERGRPVETIRKYQTSSSDSNLQSNSNSRNIFNFSNDLFLTPTDNLCSNRKPPLSPYRARSPSPFPISLETPPSSPLTPIGVLHNLPSFMLTPILHWLYTESLMPNLDEDTCEKIINFAETQPPLIKIVDPCRKYLRLIRLKKFVVDIIMDSHNVLNKIIQSLNHASISHQPAAFFNVYRDSLREGAVGCAKILQFCSIFIKDAADISRLQKHEIIKYVRTRLPIFMSQIHQLLKNLLSVFISLSSEEKSELIVYIVPKIESWLKILTNVIEEIKNSLEKMCKDLKCSHLDLSMNKEETEFYTSKRRVAGEVDVFSVARPTMYNVSSEKKIISGDNDLKFVLYMYEVRKMRDIYGRIAAALDIIREKKSAFCEMNYANKKSTIHQNLEQLILDIPTYILLIENISDRLDDKIGWKEFKFCFKLATSQINGVIIKLLDHKSALSEPINHICKLVQKSEFARSLIDLGLLEPTNILQNDLKNSTENEKGATYDYKNVKLNLIKSLCEPPIVANSSLSKNALRLLHSGQLSDMEFEVHVAQNSHGSKEGEDYCRPTQIHTFRAHRVIVSARCEWFKKALLSGMQESINRKIIISDTSPVIFRRLLLYLYGAPIDKTVGAEQICELMLLADRYSVDDLKELCENTLNALIDEESVLCLLGIADRFMASVLKSNCLSFISQHADLTKSDMFKELPTSIQLEVQDLIHWYGRVPEPWSDGFKPRSSSRHSLKSPSKSRSRSRKSSPSFL